ncbi:glycosyltransferase family 4 protein [Halalkalicoccus salilacus]|uniref:glycosyltransferase family 4 protein n=1 Tax=Halalkalicoccus salilacus TaxID=3117459 RepID=UPI00300EE8C9
MNVALVQSTPLPPAEGIGNHTLNLARQLRRKDHDVHLFTRGNWTGSKDTIDGFPTTRPACPPLYPFHAHIHRLPLERAIAQEGPFDIIHLHSPLVPFPKLECPTVVTIHTSIGADIDSVPKNVPGYRFIQLQAPFSKAIERDLLEKADAVTCVSTSMKKIIKDSYDRPIDVVHNGVDIDEFEYKNNIREKNSLLYIGRLGTRKGIPRLLSMAQELVDRDIAFKLRIAGKGPLEDKMQQMISEHQLENHVEFLGFVERDELLRLLQKTTIFVHLPEFEGLPTTVIEAMASATPVLVTDVPGCRDLIQQDKDGKLVPKNDIDRIASEVINLLENSEKRQRMGQMARKSVEQNFDWERIATEYVNVYQRVVV